MTSYDSYLAKQVDDYMTDCEPREINRDGETNCDCCDNYFCEHHPNYCEDENIEIERQLAIVEDQYQEVRHLHAS